VIGLNLCPFAKAVQVKNLIRHVCCEARDTAALRDGAFLEPEVLNETNRLEVFVFANDATRQALLVARLDNLGKGASGAAVQNLNVMLGLPEGTALD